MSNRTATTFFLVEVLPSPTRSIGAGVAGAHAKRFYLYIYNYSFFLRAGIWSGYFFRLGGSRGFSELEILSQIASFERRLWGAAPTPLILPYPFGTSTCTRIEVERDKREVRKNSYFERYSPFTLRILMYGEIDKIKLGKIYYFQIGVKFCPTTNNI